MTVRTLVDAHLCVTDRVYHYTAPTEAVDSGEPYIVWGETGILDYSADDGPAEWAVEGASYYYTRREYDQDFDLICAYLDSCGIAFKPGRISWDDATATMVYEITWTVETVPCGVYDYEDDDE